SSRRRHTRWPRDWSSDVCSSDLIVAGALAVLDDAARGGHRSMLVDSAREQLTQQRPGGVADSLKRAREALADGHLVEPAERNARSEERRVGKGCRSGGAPAV